MSWALGWFTTGPATSPSRELLTIGIIWVNHHTVFTQIRRVDRLFLLINVTFLMTVAFIPFPTSLIASQLHGNDLEPAALAYGATLTITGDPLQRAVDLCLT